MATFTNQATLTYGGTTVSSNVVTGEIAEILSVTKTALTETYRAGDTPTYIISLVNTGSVSLTDLTVTDDLGATETEGGTTVTPSAYIDGNIRYYINGVLQGAPTVTAGPPMTITGIDVPAGGNTTIVYGAALNEFASPAPGGSVTNTVTVTGAGLTAPITADETITAVSEPVLTITKAISPSTVSEDQPLTYTFLIQNFGGTEADAAQNAVINDIFDPILSDLTVTYNGAALTESSDYTYDEATGAFATVAGVITVPAATFTRDPATGAYTTVPGTATLTVTGTV